MRIFPQGGPPHTYSPPFTPTFPMKKPYTPCLESVHLADARQNQSIEKQNFALLAPPLTDQPHACSLLIFLWVRDERNMNAFHTNKADLFDVYERVFSANKIEGAYWTPAPLAAELKRRLTEIRYASAFDPDQSATFEVGDKIITMTGAAADSDFFKMFSYPVLEGTPAAALDAPDKIAISNQQLGPVRLRHQLALSPRHRRLAKRLDLSQPRTYIQLNPGVNPTIVDAKVLHFMDSYLTTSREGAGFHIELGLQKFEEVYLRSNFRNGYPAGRIEYVRLFT